MLFTVSSLTLRPPGTINPDVPGLNHKNGGRGAQSAVGLSWDQWLARLGQFGGSGRFSPGRFGVLFTFTGGFW